MNKRAKMKPAAQYWFPAAKFVCSCMCLCDDAGARHQGEAAHRAVDGGYEAGERMREALDVGECIEGQRRWFQLDFRPIQDVIAGPEPFRAI
jgi:hypothetical protein